MTHTHLIVWKETHSDKFIGAGDLASLRVGCDWRVGSSQRTLNHDSATGIISMIVAPRVPSLLSAGGPGQDWREDYALSGYEC
jgi:hypothetical protein